MFIYFKLWPQLLLESNLGHQIRSPNLLAIATKMVVVWSTDIQLEVYNFSFMFWTYVIMTLDHKSDCSFFIFIWQFIRRSEEHKNTTVTALCWDKDECRLFAGDVNGVVSVIHIPVVSKVNIFN